MPFSRRTAWPREPNAFSTGIAAAKTRGPLLDLTVSNPSEAGLGWDPAALQAALQPALTRPYEPAPFGLMSAREAVAGYYAARGLSLPAERVLIVSSTSEAYLALFRLLGDPGDTVLHPTPSYPLLEFLADLSDVSLAPYPLTLGSDRWALEPSALSAAFRPKTRALVTVGPNNPTGSTLDVSERDTLLQAAARLGAAVISDEVFLDYLSPPLTFASRSLLGAADKPALSFVLSGLSKVAALPQLKLSWIVIDGPQPLVKEAMARLELILDASLSVATPVQAALPALLAGAGAVQEHLRARVRQNRAALAGHDLLPSDGGWYAMLRLAEGTDDESFALRLLEQQVLVQPGYFYDQTHPPSLVLSLIAQPDQVAKAALLLP